VIVHEIPAGADDTTPLPSPAAVTERTNDGVTDTVVSADLPPDVATIPATPPPTAVTVASAPVPSIVATLVLVDIQLTTGSPTRPDDACTIAVSVPRDPMPTRASVLAPNDTLDTGPDGLSLAHAHSTATATSAVTRRFTIT
jgi:hypothetical protein